jgi:rhamnogalacturonan endolyase
MLRASITLFWILCAVLPQPASGSFGVTSVNGSYIVDTGAGLVFRVSQASGDINSIVFNGVEYQSTTRGSHIASGLGTDTTVSSIVYGTNYAKISITTNPGNGVVSGLTHYLMVKNGVNTIHMATYTAAEPNVGELRWITRLRTSLLGNGPQPSDNRGNIGAVEASDVFRMADGTTRSKYYGDGVTRGKDRAMDMTYCGATGSGVGIWMVYDQLRESASGGIFFRDIQNQCGGTDQEIYNYMNSGHNQTEAYRVNGILHGPYALVFNKGTPPALPIDYSWIETGGLNLQGWVPASGRGVVTGSVVGVATGFQTVIGFANADAQYWTVATNGTFTSPRMKPGTYTATLFQGELAVGTAQTTVSAGTTNSLNLASTESSLPFIFKLGDWDGTPAGFRNAQLIPEMHPSDPRNSDWDQTDFTIENNPANHFPAIQARAVNGSLTLRFNLTAGQAAVGHTLRIGITCAYNNGRPKVSVNGWQPANPPASSQPSSRSFTIGTWRGNNALYTFNVPASAFIAGENVLTIFPISGSGDLGGWLSAGYVFDCIQLDGTPVAPLPPASVSASASASRVFLSWTPVHNAVSYRIKRASAPGGPYMTIATTTVARFEDKNVSPSGREYYVVSTVNALGESTCSGEVAADVKAAMVLHLPFDEGTGTIAGDATVNGSHGILLNGAGWSAGRSGSAVNMDGAGSHVSLPQGVVSRLEDFTMAGWVYLNSVSTWSRILDFGNDTTSYMFLTPRSAGGAVRFAITIASNEGEEQINGTTALTAGWQHVAVTLEGTVGILYVNGIPAGTNSSMRLKPSLLNRTRQNYIGRSQWSADPYLNGRVDDFRIYDGALTPDEIAMLLTAVGAPPRLAATGGDSQVTVSWPATHKGWHLQVQSNTLAAGVSTNWLIVPGSNQTNVVTLPAAVHPGIVFYRLTYP